jgi:hypothetical protein
VILPRSPQLCQNGGLSVVSSIGETEDIRVGEGGQSCCFWSKIPWLKKKGNVRQCVVVMQRPILLSPKLGANFHAVAVKRHSSMRK